jgi:hypothetical protein
MYFRPSAVVDALFQSRGHGRLNRGAAAFVVGVYSSVSFPGIALGMRRGGVAIILFASPFGGGGPKSPFAR